MVNVRRRRKNRPYRSMQDCKPVCITLSNDTFDVLDSLSRDAEGRTKSYGMVIDEICRRLREIDRQLDSLPVGSD